MKIESERTSDSRFSSGGVYICSPPAIALSGGCDIGSGRSRNSTPAAQLTRVRHGPSLRTGVAHGSETHSAEAAPLDGSRHAMRAPWNRGQVE